MPRKPPLNETDLFAIATYLARNEVQTEQEYEEATCGHPIPVPSRDVAGPYFILSDDANKQGRELRIYFMPCAPEPPIVDTFTDRGRRWYARGRQRRINHSNLVMQLCECGFVLGRNQNSQRIVEFMSRRFPVRLNP